MVVSGWIIKFPYWIQWQLKKLSGKLSKVVLYVDSEHDYFVFEHILPHLSKPWQIVARNKKVAEKLKIHGLKVDAWPAYPEVLIMARHSFHRFPIDDIKKIGMKHGPYYFKKMIRAEKYNAFDLYLFVTEAEVSLTARQGVKCGKAGGYPRLDALKHPATQEKASRLKSSQNFDETKKTLLFASTWDRSGMSAIERWIDHLPGLVESYNILVSLHPSMSKKYKYKILSLEGVKFVNSEMLPAAMLVADFLVCDTSSVIAEFSTLNKPIITFAVDKTQRYTPEIQSMIADISVQIKTIDELGSAISSYTSNPSLKKNRREYWNEVFFGDTGISHGEKAAGVINTFLSENLRF
jgi:hypothetical protein